MKTQAVVAAVAAITTLSAPPALADSTWKWLYTGAGIEASGTFSVSDEMDADGFRHITAITGHRNGDVITWLHPTGQAIPGNEPYALDNLVRIGGPGQITVHGFGFSTASGGYANPFFADFLPTPAYMEVFTTASSFNEVGISFTASPVPEPAGLALTLAGLATAGFASAWRRRAA